MIKKVTYRQLLKYYGSNIGIADAFGMTRQAVHQWKKRGVPEWAQDEHRETLTSGKLKADV
jgi:hypothetical protein